MDPDRKAIIQICRESLAAYAVMMDPNYKTPAHVDIMIQAAERVESGEWPRTMVNLPPRHSKTQTWSVNLPAWFMGRNPSAKVMVVTYGQDLADRIGGFIRGQMRDPVFAEIFPECELSKSTNAKNNFQTTAKGEFLATTIGGQAGGFGADLLLIDDPIKNAQDAYSPTIRQKVIEEYRSVFYPRLMPGGRICIILTRWHDGDLQGWLLDPEEQQKVQDWKLVIFPAIAERDEGWRDEGDALWPEAFPLPVLEDIKTVKGDWDWASQYQQRPSAIEGFECKRAWWQYYEWDPHMVLDRSISRLIHLPFQIVQSWDFASESSQQHDYQVCTTWLCTEHDDYVLDVFRKKMIIADMDEKANELANIWRPDILLLEDSTQSKSVCQSMEKRRTWPIIRRKPLGPKDVRFRAVTPRIQAGRVWVPSQAPWLKDFINEMTAFPTGAHDDQCDSLSMLLLWRIEQRRDDRDWGAQDRYTQDVQDPYIV